MHPSVPVFRHAEDVNITVTGLAVRDDLIPTIQPPCFFRTLPGTSADGNMVVRPWAAQDVLRGFFSPGDVAEGNQQDNQNDQCDFVH